MSFLLTSWQSRKGAKCQGARWKAARFLALLVFGALMIFGNLPSSAQATTLRSNAQGGYLSGQNDLSCLALTIYFEARGEPLDGKLAVGHVVINRKADESFPDRICEVVKQGGEDKLYSCQFSWWCDGLSDKPVEAEAWKESIALAKRILGDAHPDPTRGALWYHADMVNPSWSQKLKKGPTIGRHIFYLDVRNPPIFTRQQLAKGQWAEY